MSQINVDQIIDKTGNGGPVLSFGCTVSQLQASGGVVVDGILSTEESFSGDGSGLTNIPLINAPKAYSLGLIFAIDFYRTWHL